MAKRRKIRVGDDNMREQGTELRGGRSKSQGYPWGAAGAESGQQGPRRR